MYLYNYSKPGLRNILLKIYDILLLSDTGPPYSDPSVSMPSAAVLQSMVVQEDPTCDLQIYEDQAERSEEHTSELQSRETISYAVFCLKKKKKKKNKSQQYSVIIHMHNYA